MFGFRDTANENGSIGNPRSGHRQVIRESVNRGSSPIPSQMFTALQSELRAEEQMSDVRLMPWSLMDDVDWGYYPTEYLESSNKEL